MTEAERQELQMLLDRCDTDLPISETDYRRCVALMILRDATE